MEMGPLRSAMPDYSLFCNIPAQGQSGLQVAEMSIDLNVFSSPEIHYGYWSHSTKKDVCRRLSDLVSSLSLLVLSLSRKHYLLYLFAASKHNQPFLGISSKINSLILLPSTWKEKFPLVASAAAGKLPEYQHGLMVLNFFPPFSLSFLCQETGLEVQAPFWG